MTGQRPYTSISKFGGIGRLDAAPGRLAALPDTGYLDVISSPSPGTIRTIRGKTFMRCINQHDPPLPTFDDIVWSFDTPIPLLSG